MAVVGDGGPCEHQRADRPCGARRRERAKKGDLFDWTCQLAFDNGLVSETWNGTVAVLSVAAVVKAFATLNGNMNVVRDGAWVNVSVTALRY